MNSSTRFSKIEEEREQPAVEIWYLQAKDAEFLKQQDSLVAKLKMANDGISRKLVELEERIPKTRLLMPIDLLETTRKQQNDSDRFGSVTGEEDRKVTYDTGELHFFFYLRFADGRRARAEHERSMLFPSFSSSKRLACVQNNKATALREEVRWTILYSSFRAASLHESILTPQLSQLAFDFGD
ncbi:hypothetical protein ACH5RR_017581 [Cinchona calisaya]|uniref:Uncharacterized protein n=1 Tax=Cinchona calisaya TaxID=153742 RepID=A0ABD2ZIZ1_9GENT